MNNAKSRRANKRIKKSAHTQESQPSRAPQSVVRRGVPRWLIAIPCILVTGVATYFVFEHFVWAKVPSALVGKWEITDGKQEGAVLGFRRDGTFIGFVDIDGKLGTIESRVTIQDKTIRFTSIHPTKKQKSTRIQTIEKLTADKLVLKDPKTKEVFRLRRIN